MSGYSRCWKDYVSITGVVFVVWRRLLQQLQKKWTIMVRLFKEMNKCIIIMNFYFFTTFAIFGYSFFNIEKIKNKIIKEIIFNRKSENEYNNLKDKFDNISMKIVENEIRENDYKEQIEYLNNKIVENENVYKEQIEYLNNKIVENENVYKEQIEYLNNKIVENENVYKEQIEYLNNKIVENEKERTVIVTKKHKGFFKNIR
jgi:hypothetical protein